MAISLAVLVGVGGTAFGQQPSVVPPTLPAPPPVTQWAPIGPPPAAQPGLVPNTLTIQKEAGTTAPTPPALPPLTFQKGAGETVPMVTPPPAAPSLPPMGVPAIPVKMVRDPQQEPKKDPTVPDKDRSTQPMKDPDGVPREAPRTDVPKAQDKQPELTKGTLPTRGNVFRLTSDGDLNKRIQQELGNRTDPFPAAAPLSAEPLVYQPKTLSYPPMKRDREPNYVVHRRLYFEEKNAERAGWEIGFLQPFLSAGHFYKDVFFLPHNYASGLWKNRWDTSAGKCMPGSPTPYYLYPQGFTVSGLMFQATVWTGLPFIFPG